MTWDAELAALSDFFEQHDFASPWLEKNAILQSVGDMRATLERDLAYLEKKASFIFSFAGELDSQTRKTVELFRDFTIGGQCPSLAALSVFAMKHFDVRDEKLRKLVLGASILGEVENPQPYHSNMHFRKVTFQIMRMIAVYNDIYDGTSRAFDERDIALLLATACIHDFGHDGKGNTIKGIYIPHRLEQNSYDLAAPVFRALGYDDEKGLAMIHLMLICTDVTPFKDAGNAVGQAKAAYRHHFLGGNNKLESLNLDGELEELEDSPASAAMTLMMHEADIATSAGLHYDITKYETGLLMKEIADGEARPEHVINFLNDICNRQMLSEVGQQLYAANMARIYALAEDDLKSGNKPYPALEQSNFVKDVHPRVIHVEGPSSIN